MHAKKLFFAGLVVLHGLPFSLLLFLNLFVIFIVPVPIFFLCVTKKVNKCSQGDCFQFLSGVWGRVINARRFIKILVQVSLELCFYLLLAQAADIELLYGISFLPTFGFELQMRWWSVQHLALGIT